jgi:gamma-glutamyltranspeptidase/glutathione hydrolase
MSDIPFGSAKHLHIVNEAKKLVFEDRAKYYADMNFVKVPFNNSSKEYGDKRRALIDLDKSGTYQAGKVSHTGPYI